MMCWHCNSKLRWMQDKELIDEKGKSRDYLTKGFNLALQDIITQDRKEIGRIREEI